MEALTRREATTCMPDAIIGPLEPVVLSFCFVYTFLEQQFPIFRRWTLPGKRNCLASCRDGDRSPPSEAPSNGAKKTLSSSPDISWHKKEKR